MRFSTIFVALASASATVATAIPALTERQSALCSGSYQAQCCATDVLGLADLDCATRKFLLLESTCRYHIPTSVPPPLPEMSVWHAQKVVAVHLGLTILEKNKQLRLPPLIQMTLLASAPPLANRLDAACCLL